MFDSVKKSISGFGNFSEKELEEITSRLKVMHLKKDACLVKEGRTCREFYFINRGSFKQYMILDNGTEAIQNLYTEHEWLFEYKSLTSQKPAETIIQATEDSEVFELHGSDFHELVKISDAFFRVGIIFQQAIQNQDYQSNRMSPEEKYALLLSKKPTIIQKFPLKYIASYLGMTPETLSRIRRKMIS